MSITAEPLDPAAAPEDTEQLARSRSPLFRAVWRWHFYAGLLSIPIIVLLCLTGIVYLFKPQLNSLLYGRLLHVAPAAQTVTYQQQLDAVERTYPGRGRVHHRHPAPPAAVDSIRPGHRTRPEPVGVRQPLHRPGARAA